MDPEEVKQIPEKDPKQKPPEVRTSTPHPGTKPRRLFNLEATYELPVLDLPLRGASMISGDTMPTLTSVQSAEHEECRRAYKRAKALLDQRMTKVTEIREFTQMRVDYLEKVVGGLQDYMEEYTVAADKAIESYKKLNKLDKATNLMKVKEHKRTCCGAMMIWLEKIRATVLTGDDRYIKEPTTEQELVKDERMKNILDLINNANREDKSTKSEDPNIQTGVTIVLGCTDACRQVQKQISELDWERRQRLNSEASFVPDIPAASPTKDRKEAAGIQTTRAIKIRIGRSVWRIRDLLGCTI